MNKTAYEFQAKKERRGLLGLRRRRFVKAQISSFSPLTFRPLLFFSLNAFVLDVVWLCLNEHIFFDFFPVFMIHRPLP